MSNFNYIENALKDKKDYINEVYNASEKFFNSLPVCNFSLKKMEVKCCRQDDRLYLFQKIGKSIKVYIDKIHDFQREKNDKEILHYTLERLKEIDKQKNPSKEDLYLTKVFSYNPEDSEDNVEKFLNILKDNNNKENYEVLKEVFSQEMLENLQFLKDLNSNFKCSFEATTLKDYTDLLYNSQFLQTNYDHEFYKSLLVDLNKDTDEKLEDLSYSLCYLKETAIKNKLDSYKNSFEFNDLDNHVYVQNNCLVLTDQNCGFYVKLDDKDNYTIYFLDKEYCSVDKEIKRIEELLSSDSINELKDVCLQVKDGKTIIANSVLMYVLELDVEFSCKAMEDEYGKKSLPVDIHSYEYMKNYYYTKYGYNEFQFLAQAFLTIGGGFTYDKEKGILFDNSVKYLKKLKKEKRNNEKVTQFNYCCPKKISYLNQDWKKGLEYLVEVLKRDNPTPVAYEGEDPEDAVKKAIKYYELKLAKL